MKFKSSILKSIKVIIALLFGILLLTESIFGNGLLKSDSTRIINLCDSAIDYLPNYFEGFDLLNEADELAVDAECNNCIGEIEYTRGIIFYEATIYDSAVNCFKQSLELFRENSNSIRIVDAHEYLGYCYMGLFDYDESIRYSKSGLLFADSLGLDGDIANLHLLIGYNYDELGKYEKSAASLMKALKIFESISDSNGMSSALISLGMIFGNDNNYVDAFKYTKRALKICEEKNDLIGISACLNNIGDIYGSQKDFESALDYFQRSLVIDRQLNSLNGIAIGLNNIGDTYRDLHDTILAISYYFKSLEIGRPNSYPIVSIVLSNLGEIYLSKGDLDIAIDYALESLKVAKEVEDREQIVNCYDLLQEVYYLLGNYKVAYSYLEKYHNLSDSVFSVAKSKHIREIMAKYNDEKQRSEIINLKKLNITESQYRKYLLYAIFSISALIISLFVINIIITRSRKLVRKQKMYYEKLLFRSEDFIFVIGADGLTKYISPSYERRIGREISNRVGESPFEFIHPEDVEFVQQEFRNLMADNKPRNIDFRMMDSTGNYLTVYAYGQNLMDDEIIAGVVVNFWDITQRKKNEELIIQSENKFRQIFNAFPDIYFQSDLKGVITEVSPSVYKMTGYTREEVIGVSSKEYYHFISDWKKIAARFQTNPYVNDHDAIINKKDGTKLYCSFSAELIYNKNDTPIGVKGILRDISSRIRSQKKLYESQLKLKEANSAKEKIFSIIAHDLIGPIGTNKSIVDLIMSQLDELTHEEIITLISSLKPSLDSTYALIENLLSWARIQQDRLKPNYEIISLNKLVDQVVGLVEGQAKQKSIDFEIIADREIQVLVDKIQMDIVIRNIVSNAIKFSNENSKIKISISCDEGIVELQISDKGIGIDKSQINNILTGKGSTNVRRGTNNEKGTGFGLVIVNEFVKSNNGKILITSNKHDGTTFKILLPLITNS